MTFDGTSSTIPVDLYFMKNEPASYWSAEGLKLYVKTWSKHGEGAGDPAYEGQEIIDNHYITMKDITAGDPAFASIPASGRSLPNMVSAGKRSFEFKMNYPVSITTNGLYSFYLMLEYKGRRSYSHTIQDFIPSSEFYDEEFFNEDFLG